MASDRDISQLEIELAIVKAEKIARAESDLLYASHIVQKIVFWLIALIAATVVIAGVNLAVQYLFKAVAR